MAQKQNTVYYSSVIDTCAIVRGLRMIFGRDSRAIVSVSDHRVPLHFREESLCCYIFRSLYDLHTCQAMLCVEEL